MEMRFHEHHRPNVQSQNHIAQLVDVRFWEPLRAEVLTFAQPHTHFFSHRPVYFWGPLAQIPIHLRWWKCLIDIQYKIYYQRNEVLWTSESLDGEFAQPHLHSHMEFTCRLDEVPRTLYRLWCVVLKDKLAGSMQRFWEHTKNGWVDMFKSEFSVGSVACRGSRSIYPMGLKPWVIS